MFYEKCHLKSCHTNDKHKNSLDYAFRFKNMPTNLILAVRRGIKFRSKYTYCNLKDRLNGYGLYSQHPPIIPYLIPSLSFYAYMSCM